VNRKVKNKNIPRTPSDADDDDVDDDDAKSVSGCQTSRELCNESGSHIQCMVKAGVGLMVSLRERSVIQLYHIETLEYLQDVNVASAVMLTLNGAFHLFDVHTQIQKFVSRSRNSSLILYLYSSDNARK